MFVFIFAFIGGMAFMGVIISTIADFFDIKVYYRDFNNEYKDFNW